MNNKNALTPERKEIREAQESKWFDGYAGAATSWPYRVKQYLTKDLTEKIRAEVQAKCDEWIEKLESVKPSARIKRHSWSWCEELNHQNCCFEDYEDNAIPTKVCGHTVYVKILNSYTKRNGQQGIRAMEHPVLKISRYFNSPKGGDWHCIGKQQNFEICWDAEKERYYVCNYHRASTEKVEIHRKNWSRTAKRREFMANVKALEEGLVKDGIVIERLATDKEATGSSFNHDLERKVVMCSGPEIGG